MEPLPEQDFSGKIPASCPVDVAFAQRFSAALADKAGLVKRTSTPVVPRFGGKTVVIDLVAKDSDHTFVTLIIDPIRHMLFINIGGDFKSPAANRTADKAKQLFNEMFPGEKLEQFTRRQGMLGP